MYNQQYIYYTLCCETVNCFTHSAAVEITILGLLKMHKVDSAYTHKLHLYTVILTQLKEIVYCILWMNYEVLKRLIIKRWAVGTVTASPNTHCYLPYITNQQHYIFTKAQQKR